MIRLLGRVDSRIDQSAWHASAVAIATGQLKTRRNFAVSYEIVVPVPISEKVSSWELSVEVEDEFYQALDELGEDHFSKCNRIAAPGPTWVSTFTVNDPFLLNTHHIFTVFLRSARIQTASISTNVTTKETKKNGIPDASTKTIPTTRARIRRRCPGDNEEA